jgi:hypothetical protein
MQDTMMRFIGGSLGATLLLALGLGAIGCGRSEQPLDVERIKRKVQKEEHEEEYVQEHQEDIEEYMKYMKTKGTGDRVAPGAEAENNTQAR